MTIDFMDLTLLAFAGVAIASLTLALFALISGRRVRRRLRAAEDSVSQLEQAMQSAANIFAESDRRMSAACEQINQLTVKQGKLDASKGKAGYQQAIALSKRGADIAELIETCGVSQGEARLILTMYAKQPVPEATALAS